jgi:predicted transcriptional regulator
MSVECVALRQETPVTFAQTLHQILAEKGWSVNLLAQKSGLPYTALKAYFQTNKKTGKARLPTYGNVVVICRALGLSTDAFQDCTDWPE